MSIENSKLMNLADGKVLYDDLRGRVEARYTKPVTGIPASDIEAGVIPDPTELIDDTAGSGDTDVTWSADKSQTEVDSVVTISETQPQHSGNKLWIKDDAEETYTMPTYAEHVSGLAGKLDKPEIAGTNGQVLTSDGQGGQSWQDANRGSVIPVFTNTNGQWSCNMTFSEVMSALQANNCEGCLIDGSLFAPVTYFYDDPYGGNIQFSCVDMLGTNKFIMKMITYMVGEYIDYFERQSNTLDALAKEYSSSDSSIFPISVGDYYVYNGKLYKANTAIPTAESFKPAKWDEVKVTGELETLTNNKAPVIVNSASGAIASFDDGAELPVKDCIVSIEPVQDLHGYDNPWPAGGGVNILPPMVDGTYSGNGVTAVVKDGVATFSGTTTASGNAFIIPLAAPFTVPSDTIYLHCLNSVANSSLGPAIENSQNTSQNINYSLSPANRITGGITTKTGQTYDRIRFYIGNEIAISGTFAPMICLDNTARSYSPYSNICPITGWTGANIARTGKNLLPKATGYNSNGLTNTVNNDNSISISGTATGTGGYITNWINLPCKIKKDTVITIGTTTNIPTSRLRLFNDDGTIDVGNGTNYKTVTMSNDMTKLRLYLFTTAGESYNFTIYPQLELGSSASPYKEYVGTTVPVTFPSEAGTVYGGSLDLTTGVLTVDKTYALLDNPDGWSEIASSTVKFAYSTLFNDRKKYSDSYTGLMCSYLPVKSATQQRTARWVGATSSVFGLATGNIPDLTLEQVKADAQAGKISICYDLAELLVFQLTPAELTTLLGPNNIWADCGDISVDYCADTKTYIDQNEGVKDVQINGTSILSQGVANVPILSASQYGVAKLGSSNANFGIAIYNGELYVLNPSDDQIKTGGGNYRPISPRQQHKSVFYGLAKAAGDSTQESSSNTVGTYTESAKSAIASMLDAPETVSGTTPSITAKAGVRYICGEVSTLTIVAPASGCIDVTFTSGTTPTVLSVSSAKTGVTAIKWANGFDPTSLDANTTYEINILDGEYGVVGAWT